MCTKSFALQSVANYCLAKPGFILPCKQCRSRSDGFKEAIWSGCLVGEFEAKLCMSPIEEEVYNKEIILSSSVFQALPKALKCRFFCRWIESFLLCVDGL